jgi:hypothetical protein
MRRHVPALSLLGSLILLPACSSAPEGPPPAPEPAVAGPHLDDAFEVFPLQHADAAEVADVVNDLIRTAGGSDALRVIANPRVNALVVSGDSVSRARLRDLLVELDRAPPR